MRYLAILMLVGAACRSATSPGADLDVVTRLSRTAFKAGEPVEVSITVSNRGTAVREINSSTCPDPFVVTLGNGMIVGPADRACTLGFSTRKLNPGESFTYASIWRGDARSVTDQPRQLTPGEYVLRAMVPVIGGPVEGGAVPIRVLP